MEQTQQTSSQIQKTEVPWAGTFHNPAAIQGRLDAALNRFHVVSPAMSVGALPEGFGVAVAMIRVDAKVDAHPVGGGKLGLLKHVLDRLASGLGVRWNPAASGRLDDGKDPRFCHYRVVGSYRGFDGQWREIFDEAELDLRDGSDMAAAIMAKSRDGETQLRDMRKWILRHTLTRARLRAIRGTGIRTAYTEDELSKPFLVFGLAQTGYSNDPELRREFARMQFSAALDANSALYGAPRAEPKALPASTVRDVLELDAPEDDDVFDVAPIADPPKAATVQQAKAAPQTRQNTPPQGTPASTGQKPRETFAVGRLKGTKLEDGTDKDLSDYATWLEKQVADPEKANFRDQNAADAALCRRILTRRAGEDGEY